MITALLFDLGGVIMDIRKSRCVEAFTALGLDDPSAYFGEFSQQGPFMLLERADMTVDEFHEALRPHLSAGVTDAQIDQAFCRFLIGIPEHRLSALRKLRKKYKIYLLSNTNPIMWDATIAEEFRKEGMEREDYFDGIVTSFEAHSLKPESGIFEYAIAKFGLNPSETLFFDDSQANLNAAATLGFHTALVAPGSEFTNQLP